jgi:hypothetical protein
MKEEIYYLVLLMFYVTLVIIIYLNDDLLNKNEYCSRLFQTIFDVFYFNVVKSIKKKRDIRIKRGVVWAG